MAVFWKCHSHDTQGERLGTVCPSWRRWGTLALHVAWAPDWLLGQKRDNRNQLSWFAWQYRSKINFLVLIIFLWFSRVLVDIHIRGSWVKAIWERGLLFDCSSSVRLKWSWNEKFRRLAWNKGERCSAVEKSVRGDCILAWRLHKRVCVCRKIPGPWGSSKAPS